MHKCLQFYLRSHFIRLTSLISNSLATYTLSSFIDASIRIYALKLKQIQIFHSNSIKMNSNCIHLFELTFCFIYLVSLKKHCVCML